MARIEENILGITGRVGKFTVYDRKGKKILRVANSHQPHRLSRKQLDMRQRFGHNTALWRVLRSTNMVFFEGDKGADKRFMSINKESPVPYITKQQYRLGISLLLPDMVISYGTLHPISYELGEIDGKPALLTDLTPQNIHDGEYFLYMFRQNLYHYSDSIETPKLTISVDKVVQDKFVIVPSTLLTPYKSKTGCLAIIDDQFGDSMMGFGLVHVKDGHASTQYVVTHCTYYERYTTEEALQATAKSYGGLTGEESHL